MFRRKTKTLIKNIISIMAAGVFLLSVAGLCACFEVETQPTVQPYINIAFSGYDLGKGQSLRLSAAASDGSAISWTTSDSSVATVASDGTVLGVNFGEAVITASSSTAGTAECLINVVTAQSTEHTLIWSDEFEGDSLDMTKWNYQTGVYDVYGTSTGVYYWGNNEEEYYTEDAATVEDGCLVITATKEEMPEGRGYSSARITTRDNFYTTYGYFEAKMRTPAENGMWPAFWMLPQPSQENSTRNEYGGWPYSGEIDIMEAKGRLGNKIDTTLHYSYDGSHAYTGSTYTMSSSTEEWHIYALEWTQSYMTWYIDGVSVMTVNSSAWNNISGGSGSSPFDKPFYILFDLAVGGTYDSVMGSAISPDDDFTSASMYVDYIRVYTI